MNLHDHKCIRNMHKVYRSRTVWIFSKIYITEYQHYKIVACSLIII